jgi:FMN phosphatase YigB (HAD superfamily)
MNKRMSSHIENEIQLTGIKAVVLDVFGTLVEIGDKRRPYVQLLKLLHAAGRPSKADDGIQIMSNNVGLAGAIHMFDWELPAESIAALELDLYAELPTIKMYPEALVTLDSLRAGGLKIGLCSNLAAPYAVPVKTLLPFELDAYAWSFEVGAVKPEALIYRYICDALQCLPHEVVMIGDTFDADYTGPNSYGMQGFYLARDGEKLVKRSLTRIDEILPLLGLKTFVA